MTIFQAVTAGLAGEKLSRTITGTSDVEEPPDTSGKRDEGCSSGSTAATGLAIVALAFLSARRRRTHA